MGRLKVIHGGVTRRVVALRPPPIDAPQLQFQEGDFVYAHDESKSFRLARVTHTHLVVRTERESPGRESSWKEGTVQKPAVEVAPAADVPLNNALSQYAFDYRVCFTSDGDSALLSVHDGDSSMLPASPENVCKYNDCNDPSTMALLLPEAIPSVMTKWFIEATRHGHCSILSFLFGVRKLNPREEMEEGESALRVIAGMRCVDGEAEERSLWWFITLMEKLNRGDDDSGNDFCRAMMLQQQLKPCPDFHVLQQNPRRNLFHDAAAAGNERFLVTMLQRGSTVPDYQEQIQNGQFSFSNGSFEETNGNCVWHLSSLKETICPLEYADLPDENGQFPIELAAKDSETHHAFQTIMRIVGSYKLSRHAGRDFIHCGVKDQRESGDHVKELEEIIETKRYGLNHEIAAEIFTQEPYLLYKLCTHGAIFRDEFTDASVTCTMKWVLKLSGISVDQPLGELTDHRGYRFPNVPSIVDSALSKIGKERQKAVNGWNCYLKKEDKMRACMVAVMMASHPRLGANSPLGLLPQSILRDIAQNGAFDKDSLKFRTETLMEQSQYCSLSEPFHVAEVPFSLENLTSSQWVDIENFSRESAKKAYFRALGIADHTQKDKESDSFQDDRTVKTSVPGLIRWLADEARAKLDSAKLWDSFVDRQYVEGLQWLLERGQGSPPLDDVRARKLMRRAAEIGSVHLLRWLLEEAKPPFIPTRGILQATVIEAIKRGHHHVARYLELSRFLDFDDISDDSQMMAVLMSAGRQDSLLAPLPTTAVQTIAAMIGRTRILPVHVYLQHSATPSGFVNKGDARLFCNHLHYYYAGSEESEDLYHGRTNDREDFVPSPRVFQDGKRRRIRLGEFDKQEFDWGLTDAFGRSTLSHAQNSGNAIFVKMAEEKEEEINRGDKCAQICRLVRESSASLEHIQDVAGPTAKILATRLAELASSVERDLDGVRGLNFIYGSEWSIDFDAGALTTEAAKAVRSAVETATNIANGYVEDLTGERWDTGLLRYSWWASVQNKTESRFDDEDCTSATNFVRDALRAGRSDVLEWLRDLGNWEDSATWSLLFVFPYYIHCSGHSAPDVLTFAEETMSDASNAAVAWLKDQEYCYELKVRCKKMGIKIASFKKPPTDEVVSTVEFLISGSVNMKATQRHRNLFKAQLDTTLSIFELSELAKAGRWKHFVVLGKACRDQPQYLKVQLDVDIHMNRAAHEIVAAVLKQGRCDLIPLIRLLGFWRQGNQMLTSMNTTTNLEGPTNMYPRTGLPTLRVCLQEICDGEEGSLREFALNGFGALLDMAKRIETTDEKWALRKVLVEIFELLLESCPSSSRLDKIFEPWFLAKIVLSAYFVALLGSDIIGLEEQLNWILDSYQLNFYVDHLERAEVTEQFVGKNISEDDRDALVAFHQRRIARKRDVDAFVQAINEGVPLAELKGIFPRVGGMALRTGRVEIKGIAAEDPENDMLNFFGGGAVLTGQTFLEAACFRDRSDVIIWLARDCPSASFADWKSLPRFAGKCRAVKVAAVLARNDFRPTGEAGGGDITIVEAVELKRLALLSLRRLFHIHRQRRRQEA